METFQQKFEIHAVKSGEKDLKKILNPVSFATCHLFLLLAPLNVDLGYLLALLSNAQNPKKILHSISS